jgi:uncharacterized protein YecE (DUF72 family)
LASTSGRSCINCREVFIAISIGSMPSLRCCRRTLGEAGGTPASHVLRHAIEFRHPSWYVDETYALLDKHGVAMCLHDMAGSAITDPFVGPFDYIRFHGPGGRYFGRYDLRRLETWAARIEAQACKGRHVFAYFNNDPEGMAVINARELQQLLGTADK